MIGRTNALPSAGEKITLYSPTLSLSGNNLKIENRNGLFADGYILAVDKVDVAELSLDELTVYMPDYINNSVYHTLYVRAFSSRFGESTNRTILYKKV